MFEMLTRAFQSKWQQIKGFFFPSSFAFAADNDKSSIQLIQQENNLNEQETSTSHKRLLEFK